MISPFNTPGSSDLFCCSHQRERARQVNGSILFNSSPGKGTRIEVTVPLQDPAQFSGSSVANTNAVGRPRRSILLLDTDMKTPRNLGLVAIVVFVISHFLPAYEIGSGFACFRYCWNVLVGREGDVLTGGWFYYSGFAISNILFIGLVAALFVTKKRRRLRSVVSVVFFLHILSWLVLHIFPQPSQITEIEIGYYVWLIAYGLLVAAHLCSERVESPGSISLAGSSA